MIEKIPDYEEVRVKYLDKFSITLIAILFWLGVIAIIGLIFFNPVNGAIIYPEPVNNGNYTLWVSYIDSNTIRFDWNGTIGEIQTEFMDGIPQPITEEMQNLKYFFARNLTSGALHTFEIHSENGANVISAYTDNSTPLNNPIEDFFNPSMYIIYANFAILCLLLGMIVLREIHLIGGFMAIISIVMYVTDTQTISGIKADLIFFGLIILMFANFGLYIGSSGGKGGKR